MPSRRREVRAVSSSLQTPDDKRTEEYVTGSSADSPMSEQRQHFQQQLSGLENHALGGLDLVVEQLDRVVEALEHQDIERMGDQCVNVAKLIR